MIKLNIQLQEQLYFTSYTSLKTSRKMGFCFTTSFLFIIDRISFVNCKIIVDKDKNAHS